MTWYTLLVREIFLFFEIIYSTFFEPKVYYTYAFEPLDRMISKFLKDIKWLEKCTICMISKHKKSLSQTKCTILCPPCSKMIYF